MLIKTKLALAALLIAGTASTAFAQMTDTNPANRGYPAYATPQGMDQPFLGNVAQRPVATQRITRSEPRGTFQSAPAGLYQGPQFGGDRYESAPQFETDEVGVDLHDHASSPYASGGGN